MKASALTLASALVASSTAISIGQRSSAPRIIGLNLERSVISDPIAHDRNRLARRAGVVSETLDNEQNLYYANVTIGTPPQALRLHIDTGSSDLWVNTANSTLCEDSQSGGCNGGTYSPASSSTYKYVNSAFNISYADGTGSSGEYVRDTLRIGGQTLTGFQLGVGFISSSTEGVLGIGYTANEVQVGRAGLDPYPNLPAALVDAGLINSNAYSLWLNDVDANTGTILFGGVDTAKYTGDLATIPIVQEYGQYLEFIIAMTGITIAGTSYTSSSLPASVLLDSGTTLAYLPDDIVSAIYTQVQATYVSSDQIAYVQCSLKDSSSTIDFDFSGQTIKVPYNELVLDQSYNSDGMPQTFDNGEAACVFGIAPSSSSSTNALTILGDTFLRSAYVVYDLANNEISLAQTDFNSTGSDVREITSGAKSVPGAQEVANPVTTVVAGTGGARLDGPTSTVTSSPTGLNNASERRRVEIVGAMLAVIAVLFATL